MIIERDVLLTYDDLEMAGVDRIEATRDEIQIFLHPASLGAVITVPKFMWVKIAREIEVTSQMLVDMDNNCLCRWQRDNYEGQSQRINGDILDTLSGV